MKKLMLFFVALFMIAGLNAQNTAYSKTIHRDFGTFEIESDDGHVVSIAAFVTVEFIDPNTHSDDIVVRLRTGAGNSVDKELVLPKEFILPEFHYDLYLVSKSIYGGDTTSTWMGGVKVFIDGEDMRKEQFPDGFSISIKTTPTLVYSHHSTKTDIDIEITWERAIYEPRIRK